jgi:hypothetical protein
MHLHPALLHYFNLVLSGLIVLFEDDGALRLPT